MDNVSAKSVIIGRRYLLNFCKASTALIAFTWIFGDLSEEREQTMTTSNEKFAVEKTEEEWLQQLTPEQFRVLRKHGTERAGTSPLDKLYEPGIYSCAGCGQPLFSSETKFNSGTGWPSFYQPIEGAIATSIDKTLFMTRVEVHCSRCGGHLGHVFRDGPAPTGLRYCMNGVALNFTPAEGDNS
ncbi:putative methionine sulfoxide reductase B [Calothrix sp. NIES-3974]|nr:putative methionine sulfoxide reductase B [Calothrix sp. NIES-3974]